MGVEQGTIGAAGLGLEKLDPPCSVRANSCIGGRIGAAGIAPSACHVHKEGERSRRVIRNIPDKLEAHGSSFGMARGRLLSLVRKWLAPVPIL